jgi:uncharacterized protein involved in copper resistance
MKSIISGAVLATAIVACLSLNSQAKSVIHLSSTEKTIALSDTGKMDKMSKGKMKTDKMEKKKMDKMSKDKMKTGKMKMDKMKKDTSGKM